MSGYATCKKLIILQLKNHGSVVTRYLDVQPRTLKYKKGFFFIIIQELIQETRMRQVRK